MPLGSVHITKTNKQRTNKKKTLDEFPQKGQQSLFQILKDFIYFQICTGVKLFMVFTCDLLTMWDL